MSHDVKRWHFLVVALVVLFTIGIISHNVFAIDTHAFHSSGVSQKFLNPPVNLTAILIVPTEVDLDWITPSPLIIHMVNGKLVEPNSFNQSKNVGQTNIQLIGYKIERSDGGNTWTTLLENTGNSTTSYADTTVQPDTSYSYRVSTITSIGTSSPSNLVNLTTPTLAGRTVSTIDPNSSTSVASIAIGSDGFPVMAYFDFNSNLLKVAHCGKMDCSTGNRINVISREGAIYNDIAIATGSDGFPIVAYWEAMSGNLKIAHCGNIDCSQGNLVTVADPTYDVGQYVSLTIGNDGLPIMSYHGYGSGIKVLHCGSLDCSRSNVFARIDPTQLVDQPSSIAIASDGMPIISYDDYNEHPKIAHCTDMACQGKIIITALSNKDLLIYARSLAIGSDGFPVMSFWGAYSGYNLAIMHCNNLDCSAGNSLNSVDSEFDSGQNNSVMIGKDGFPLILYIGGFNDYTLRIRHCTDYACSTNSTLTGLDSYDSGWAFFAVGKDGFPVIPIFPGSHPSVIHCNNILCSSTR